MEWIEQASYEQLSLFTKAVTGSSVLSASNHAIIITESRGAYYFHSCGRQVDIPFSLYKTKSEFLEEFSAMIDGFGFNTA